MDSHEPRSLADVEAKASEADDQNFFRIVQGHVVEAARVVDMPEHLGVILSQPKNELIVHFPVRMDDGTHRLFKGYRIQHNNLLGTLQGRHSLPPERGPRRCEGARGHDDLEVRADGHPLRRGQGRHQVQPP
jgi:hypothetical protein